MATVQEHLRDLQELVQDALKKWNLATNSSQPASVIHSRTINEVHPLGPVQVSSQKRAFGAKVMEIATICQSFGNGPLQESLNSGNPATTAALRKYAALLKEEAVWEAALNNAKESMKACKDILKSASQSGITRTEHLIDNIKGMASELGLECYLDTSMRPNSTVPVSTLTIGGNAIVVDIDVESTGAILRVKVSYAAEHDQDVRIDQLLAQNLRCGCGKLSFNTSAEGITVKHENGSAVATHSKDCSRDLQAFHDNLKSLATLDRFTKQYPHVDVFHSIRSMDNDLREIYRRELAASGDDFQRVFYHGHGLPFYHAVSPGPSIAYWAPKVHLSGISWQDIGQAIEQGKNDDIKFPMHRLCIGMEDSPPLGTRFLPSDRPGCLLTEQESMMLVANNFSVPYGSVMKDNQHVGLMTVLKSPLDWIVPNQDMTIEATYVATLHPPVPVSESVARQLTHFSNNSTAGQNNSSTMGTLSEDHGFLSLQEILLEKNLDPTQWEIVVDSGTDDAVKQNFSLERRRCAARLIRRIPFAHVSQLHQCVRLLRQQVVYNALFKSCFDVTPFRNSSDDTTLSDISSRRNSQHPQSRNSFSSFGLPLAHHHHGLHHHHPHHPQIPEVSVMVFTPNAPHHLAVSFLNPYTTTFVTLDFCVDSETGRLTAQQRASIEMLTFETAPFSSQMQQTQGQSSRQQQNSNRFNIRAESLTQALQGSENIPILIQWVLKQSQQWHNSQMESAAALTAASSTATTGGGSGSMDGVVGGSNDAGAAFGRRASRVVGDDGGILKKMRM